MRNSVRRLDMSDGANDVENRRPPPNGSHRDGYAHPHFTATSSLLMQQFTQRASSTPTIPNNYHHSSQSQQHHQTQNSTFATPTHHHHHMLHQHLASVASSTPTASASTSSSSSSAVASSSTPTASASTPGNHHHHHHHLHSAMSSGFATPSRQMPQQNMSLLNTPGGASTGGYMDDEGFMHVVSVCRCCPCRKCVAHVFCRHQDSLNSGILFTPPSEMSRTPRTRSQKMLVGNGPFAFSGFPAANGNAAAASAAAVAGAVDMHSLSRAGHNNDDIYAAAQKTLHDR